MENQRGESILVTAIAVCKAHNGSIEYHIEYLKSNAEQNLNLGRRKQMGKFLFQHEATAGAGVEAPVAEAEEIKEPEAPVTENAGVTTPPVDDNTEEAGESAAE